MTTSLTFQIFNEGKGFLWRTFIVINETEREKVKKSFKTSFLYRKIRITSQVS